MEHWKGRRSGVWGCDGVKGRAGWGISGIGKEREGRVDRRDGSGRRGVVGFGYIYYMRGGVGSTRQGRDGATGGVRYVVYGILRLRLWLTI